jgi:hypothetical protein
MNKSLKLEIKNTVTQSIRKYFERKVKKDVQNSHVLDLIFPYERRVRSLIGGLETSLGTTLWEPLAELLAEKNGYEVLDEKILQPYPMPSKLRETLSKLKSLRERKESWVDINYCKNELLKAANKCRHEVNDYVNPPRGTGVDVFLKKDNKYYAFDIKTTQPNVSSFKGYNIQLLEWYAYTLIRYPERDIYSRIAFPFNPNKKDFWLIMKAKIFPLEKKVDAVVEDEFWDELSGIESTFSYIKETFKELGDSNFGEEFSDVFNNK